jgi:hypothetical protein
MASKVDIVSNALILVGHPAISSFDADQGAGAVVGSALFDTTLQYMLSTTYWRFSVKQQQLSRLTATPLKNWQYAHQIPTDAITVHRVTPRTNYQIFEDKIYSNQQDLWADYTYQVAPESLPLYFVQAMQYKLAADFAISITNDLSKNQLWEQKYRQEVSIAMAADAKSHPPEPIQDQPFTDVRLGYGYSLFGDY